MSGLEQDENSAVCLVLVLQLVRDFLQIYRRFCLLLFLFFFFLSLSFYLSLYLSPSLSLPSLSFSRSLSLFFFVVCVSVTSLAELVLKNLPDLVSFQVDMCVDQVYLKPSQETH